MKGLEQYDVKLLLALQKCIGGRTDFFKVLVTGGYPELAAFSNAIRADDEAMVWLFKNGYAWMAILSNAIDGQKKALPWVSQALTPVNLMYALACRRDPRALRWLVERKLDIFLMLAQTTEEFLKYQEKEAASPYTMQFGGHVRAQEALTEWKKQQDYDKERAQNQHQTSPEVGQTH